MQNLQNIYYGLTRSCKHLSERAESRTPGHPRAAKRALWSTRPHAFRHRLHVTGAHRGRPLQIVRPAMPSEATWPHLQREATLSPSSVPSSSSLLKPRCSRPPLSVSLSLSSLPTLSPRGSRRRQRLRRRSRKLQPSPASSRRRPGNKACRACSLPSSSMDLGSREVSDSGKGGS